MVDLDMIKNALESSGASANTEALQADMTFSDAGFDSLDMFNLFVELEQHTGHQVPDSKIDELNTPNAVIQYFAKLL
ncbi:acyl carrier protein [Rheinheimera sp.]|uniref:acyl carrier protein n=1 Tax=Rheinheimera sp. TaxID=1869214 RepID=UPI00307E94C3